MSNERAIWDKLISAGLTPAGAAGIMGNLYAESGLNPRNLQNSFEKKLGFTDETYTVAVDNGTYTNFVHDGAGYGLAQWTNVDRKKLLLYFSRGSSVGDLNVQMDYLLWELGQKFPGVMDKLRTTGSVREASDCVLLQFERPANQSKENCARRAGFAQEFYDKFAGGESMNYLMTSAAFCAKLMEIASNYKTAYMLGPWGWPANDKMIARATTQGSNAKTNRQWLPQATAIKDKGFLFDCVGLIKGILWGWDGDLSRTYGGAGYACNGVPDYDAKKMIDCCREVSTDFSTIVPGEAVWMDGHIGGYVGEGVVVEATPKWKGGVQRSTCLNVAGKQLPGTMGSRTWTKHGKLPWVDYTAQEHKKEDDDMVYFKTLADVPSYYRAAVDKAVKAGALNGTGDGINVSEDLCRTLTVLDRLGKLD